MSQARPDTAHPEKSAGMSQSRQLLPRPACRQDYTPRPSKRRYERVCDSRIYGDDPPKEHPEPVTHSIIGERHKKLHHGGRQ